MAILVRNISESEDLGSFQVPTRTDGKRYLFEMICDNGWSRVYDDSTSGLLEHLIAGYEAMSNEDKLAARIKHACDMQVITQARLLTFYAEDNATQKEKEILFGTRHIQPVIEGWRCTIPLILVDSFYFPYSRNPRPYSEIADVAMPSNIW